MYLSDKGFSEHSDSKLCGFYWTIYEAFYEEYKVYKTV